MITNYNNISKAIQLKCDNRKHQDNYIYLNLLHCASNEGSGGCCNNQLRVHCKKQTVRPVGSAVYE